MLKSIVTKLNLQKSRARLLLLSALLLAAGIGLLGWLIFARPTPSSPSISANPHFSATSTLASKGTPPEVVSAVRQQVAQKLRLSIDQLATKLQAATPIESLAAQQGMSASAWRAFVITTYQAAYEQALSTGKLTQTRANHDMHNLRSYPPDALNAWVTNDCLGVTPG